MSRKNANINHLCELRDFLLAKQWRNSDKGGRLGKGKGVAVAKQSYAPKDSHVSLDGSLPTIRLQGKIMKRRTPHTRIDNRIFDFMDIIGTNGFAVYAVLKKHENRHTGRCYPSYQTVADITGLDRTTVIKYTTLLVTLGLINKQAQFIDGRQTSNRYSFRDLPASNKGGGTLPPPQGGTVPPPQDREETPNPPGGGVPPQPLTPNQTLTKKQIECPHKEVASPVDGVAYCRSCYLDMTDAPQDQEASEQASMEGHTCCQSSDG